MMYSMDSQWKFHRGDLIQQKTGLVKMPGNFVIDAYPVVVKGIDILLTVLGVGLIGYITALLAGNTSK